MAVLESFPSAIDTTWCINVSSVQPENNRGLRWSSVISSSKCMKGWILRSRCQRFTPRAMDSFHNPKLTNPNLNIDISVWVWSTATICGSMKTVQSLQMFSYHRGASRKTMEYCVNGGTVIKPYRLLLGHTSLHYTFANLSYRLIPRWRPARVRHEQTNYSIQFTCSGSFVF